MGYTIVMQVVCARGNNRLYTFIIFGVETGMKGNADIVDGIYKSIHLGETVPAGSTANLKVGVVLDTRGVDDKSFNQSTWAGSLPCLGQ